MPFICLEHFDAFGALSPCFTGAFWIWYTRPRGEGVGVPKKMYIRTEPASTNPKGFNFNCDLKIEIEIWQLKMKKKPIWNFGRKLEIRKKLFTDSVSVNKKYLTHTLSVNKKYLRDTLYYYHHITSNWLPSSFLIFFMCFLSQPKAQAKTQLGAEVSIVIRLSSHHYFQLQ